MTAISRSAIQGSLAKIPISSTAAVASASSSGFGTAFGCFGVRTVRIAWLRARSLRSSQTKKLRKTDSARAVDVRSNPSFDRRASQARKSRAASVSNAASVGEAPRCPAMNVRNPERSRVYASTVCGDDRRSSRNQRIQSRTADCNPASPARPSSACSSRAGSTIRGQHFPEPWQEMPSTRPPGRDGTSRDRANRRPA